MKELKAILPENKLHFLEENPDIHGMKTEDISHERVANGELLKFQLNDNEFGVSIGLSKDEESKLMH